MYVKNVISFFMKLYSARVIEISRLISTIRLVCAGKIRILRKSRILQNLRYEQLNKVIVINQGSVRLSNAKPISVIRTSHKSLKRLILRFFSTLCKKVWTERRLCHIERFLRSIMSIGDKPVIQLWDVINVCICTRTYVHVHI